MPTDTGDASDGGDASADLTALLRHLFHAVMCPELGVAAEDKCGVKAAAFFAWLEASADAVDWAAACEAAGVGYAAAEDVRALAASGRGPDACGRAWYDVVLSDRPPAAVGVKTLVPFVLATFDDGRVAIVQAVVSREASTSGGPLSDAALAAAVAGVATGLADAVARVGAAGLYAMARKDDVVCDGPEDAFEVLMGAFLFKILPQLRPDVRRAAEVYARMFQQIVRPPIPRAAFAAAAAGDAPRGGWDVG